MSVESCSSSMACSESSRKMKDMEETTSEAFVDHRDKKGKKHRCGGTAGG